MGFDKIDKRFRDKTAPKPSRPDEWDACPSACGGFLTWRYRPEAERSGLPPFTRFLLCSFCAVEIPDRAAGR